MESFKSETIPAPLNSKNHVEESKKVSDLNKSPALQRLETQVRFINEKIKELEMTRLYLRVSLKSRVEIRKMQIFFNPDTCRYQEAFTNIGIFPF